MRSSCRKLVITSFQSWENRAALDLSFDGAICSQTAVLQRSVKQMRSTYQKNISRYWVPAEDDSWPGCYPPNSQVNYQPSTINKNKRNHHKGITFSKSRENENLLRDRFPSSGIRLSLKAPGNELKRERSIPKVRIYMTVQCQPEYWTRLERCSNYKNMRSFIHQPNDEWPCIGYSWTPIMTNSRVQSRMKSYLTKSPKRTGNPTKNSGKNSIPNLRVHEINLKARHCIRTESKENWNYLDKETSHCRITRLDYKHLEKGQANSYQNYRSPERDECSRIITGCNTVI